MDTPAIQNRSGAPPLPHFTKEQREHILSQLSGFTNYLVQHNPTVRNYDAGTTNWMASTAKNIMRHEHFERDKLDGRNPEKVESDIRTFFRNWKNNTYKKSLPTPSSNAIVPSQSPTTTRVLNDTIRGLVVLEGDLSAKEVFFRENPEEYSRAYKVVKSEVASGTPSCVIAQKAKKRAWDQADQEYWAKRKRDLELDIKGNQAVWPQFFREAVQQNLDRGVVGSALVGIMYAMRTEAEGLQYGILYAGHNSTSQTEIAHIPKMHNEILKHWADHADVHLPHLDTPSVYQFDLDEARRPKLPLLDLDEVSLRQIIEVLTLYLAALWDYGYPAEASMPCLPWAALAQHPAGYFDTEAFSIPCSVGDPVPCRSVDAPLLYESLAKFQASGTPFLFFNKEEYLSRAKDAAKRLVENAEMGDEVHADDEGGNPKDVTIETPKTDSVDTAACASTPASKPVIDDGAAAAVAIHDDGTNHPPLSSLHDLVDPPSESPCSKSPAQPAPPPQSIVQGDENPPSPTPPAQPPKTPPPPVPTPTKKSKKHSGTKRKSMGELTNLSNNGVAEPSRRGSTRTRKTVDFGLQLVAKGQRSPPGRKAGWEFTKDKTENQGPPKRARRG